MCGLDQDVRLGLSILIYKVRGNGAHSWELLWRLNDITQAEHLA